METNIIPQKKAIKQARKMIEEGGSIIDLGNQSSKPGSEEISEKEEWYKLKDVLITLRDEFNDILISIDTYRSEIGKVLTMEQILLTIFQQEI